MFLSFYVIISDFGRHLYQMSEKQVSESVSEFFWREGS